MKNRSVSRRIINIIVIIFILFGLSIVFNIISLNNSNNGLETYKKLSDDVNNFTQVETTFLEASLDFKDYLVVYEKSFEESFKKNLSFIGEYIDKLSESSVETTDIIIVKELISKYDNDFDRIVELYNKANKLLHDFNHKAEMIKEELSSFDSLCKKYSVLAFSLLPQNPIETVNTINEAVKNYFSTKSSSDKTSVLNIFSNFKNNLAFVEFGLTNDELRDAFFQLMDSIENLESEFKELVTTIESQEPIIQEMEQLRVEILSLLEDQRAQLKEQQDTLGPQLIEKNNRSILLTIILTVLAFVVAIIMVIYLIRSITKPLLELRNKINQFKEGDLTVDFQVKSKDEIGQMALALSEMSKELRNSMGSIRQASNKVQESSVNLTKTSQESRENSEELKRQMDTIQTYAEETAGNVEEVTSGVDEVARAAQGVSRDAQRLSEEAEKTNKAAQEGSQTIISISEIVKEAVERTKESQKEVTQLATNAKDVQSIVETINSITEQT
ncbi:MAG TPA: methyl-accepting chemotaxis protein, partial [Defluviitoga sp.]|nr:methyl-accepting chemotaxis protein [Defluviitoga sp.]